MIKEIEININIVGRNLNKYRDLGYKCEVGQNILININDIQKNSHVIITAICDNCKTERNISLYAYNKNYNKYNFYYCNNCKQLKIEKTNIEKYGFSRPIQNKKIRNKLEQTSLERYGNKICSKNTDIINKNKMSQISNLFKKYNFLNINNIESGNCQIFCDKNHMFDINFSLLNLRLKYKTILCTKCNPVSSTKSGLEIQFKDFILSNYNYNILYNSRSIIDPLELDIYLPELKLAFEFNGLYWHNEINKDKNYHLNKTELCEQQGIQLIHIYEDDWMYKQNIVKSIILNRLNITPNKIYARKTIIKEILDNKLVREFLNKNHIQGFVGSKIKIGLFYDNELVSLMTFGNRRVTMGKKSTNESEYELLRFCNKLNTNIVGGSSKLFNYFIDHYKPEEITTYADRSFSQGKLYETLGFKFIGKTQPNYYYIIDGLRHYRFNFRKNLLVEHGYDSNKTEHEIMLERKIFRIYDSGNLKYNFKKC